MDLKLHNASVVVLSEGNNPKLLSHDFLARNGIVPEDWQIRDIDEFEPHQERERSQYIYTIAQLRDRFLEYAGSLPFNH